MLPPESCYRPNVHKDVASRVVSEGTGVMYRNKHIFLQQQDNSGWLTSDKQALSKYILSLMCNVRRHDKSVHGTVI